MRKLDKDGSRTAPSEPPFWPLNQEKLAAYGELTLELRRRVRNGGMTPEDTKDVVKIIWWRLFVAWSKAGDSEDPTRWRGWLFRVAQYEIANAFRHMRRHPVQSLDALLHEPVDRSEEERAQRRPRERQRRLLRSWLADLSQRDPVNYRLLHGRYLKGWSVEKLAATTGLSPNQISCRIAYQIKKFRRWAERLRLEQSDEL